MTYGKDPHALRDCETGFDIADKLETRVGMEIDDSRTQKWRVVVTLEDHSNTILPRGSLPDEWEFGSVRLSEDDTTEVHLVNSRIVDGMH